MPLSRLGVNSKLGNSQSILASLHSSKRTDQIGSGKLGR